MKIASAKRQTDTGENTTSLVEVIIVKWIAIIPKVINVI